MAIDFTCPISGEERDNTTVRVVAGFTVFITIAAITAALKEALPYAAVAMGLLALDFIIRGLIKPKYSPLATLARGIVSGLKLPREMVDAAPKIFAARIGVIFSTSATILLTFDLLYAALGVLTVLLACAVMESVFSFCLGCWMYSILPKPIGNILSQPLFR